jgi:hypothetical protein
VDGIYFEVVRGGGGLRVEWDVLGLGFARGGSVDLRIFEMKKRRRVRGGTAGARMQSKRGPSSGQRRALYRDDKVNRTDDKTGKAFEAGPSLRFGMTAFFLTVHPAKLKIYTKAVPPLHVEETWDADTGRGSIPAASSLGGWNLTDGKSRENNSKSWGI